MNEETDDQQGFTDLREGRHRRITSEVLQKEQDAASSETAWRVRVPEIKGKEGRRYLLTPANIGINDTPNGELLFEIDNRDLQPALKFLNMLIVDHELAAWAVRVKEALEKIANKHSSFSSPCLEVDTHQFARAALADYPDGAAVEGAK